MVLDEDIKKLKFDSRMRDFNMRAGIIDVDQWNSHVQGLQDDSANCTQMELPEEAPREREPAQQQQINTAPAMDTGGLVPGVPTNGSGEY